MKILLIHPTFFPIIGGSESLMRLHAEGLSRYGFDVTVVTGEGEPSLGTYEVKVIPELAINHLAYREVRRVWENGQTDMSYSKYVQELEDLLRPILKDHDVTMTYGAFTTHHNLAFTQALWQLADDFRVLAWATDLSIVNPDHTVPNPKNEPWSFMRKPHPKVTYIAPSEHRREELEKKLGAAPEQVKLIQTPFSPYLLFGLAVELADWLETHSILERDLIFYYPCRLLPRKQIDQAIAMVKAVKDSGIKPALIVTALPDPFLNSTQTYVGYLTSVIQKEGLEKDVFFASRDMPWDDATWQQMYTVADVVLMPSKYESFGSVIMEAILRRVPVWHTGLPVLAELHQKSTQVIKTPAEAVEAAKKLVEQEDYILRKKLFREYNLDTVVQGKILPLLQGSAS